MLVPGAGNHQKQHFPDHQDQINTVSVFSIGGIALSLAVQNTLALAELPDWLACCRKRLVRNRSFRRYDNPLVAVVVTDLRCDARETSTVEVSPVETVVSRAETTGFIEQWTDQAAGTAAVRALSTGVSGLPFRIENRDSRIRCSGGRTGERNGEHEAPGVTNDQAKQPECMRQHGRSPAPVSPESPVIEEIPAHERGRQKSPHQRNDGKTDIGDE